MAVTTFTTTAAEDARLAAWAAAVGAPNAKALIVKVIQQQLEAFEQNQNVVTFNNGYVPINPT